MHTISSLRLGQAATITDLACSGRQRHHLEDLGFSPGSTVCPLFRDFSGNLTAYQVAGAVIALRRRDSGCVMCIIDRPSSGFKGGGAQ